MELGDHELIEVLQRYLDLLQQHPDADAMLRDVVTDDFETGFVGGFLWRGPEGLADFLSQRDGFFDERHEIQELLERGGAGAELTAHTRLRFFLRRWTAPSPSSDEFTGDCYHAWRVRRTPAGWRVAAQLVERFDDLNANAQRLFSTPDDGLNNG